MPSTSSSQTIANLWDSHSGQPLQRPKPTKRRASRSKSISTNYGNSLKDQLKATIVNVPGSPRSVAQQSNAWVAASELLKKSDNLLDSPPRTSSAKPSRKTLKVASQQEQGKSVKKSLSFTNSKVLYFDPNSIVSSLRGAPIFNSEELDTPWYEQDYQELAWWEYPDLDDDDEIKVLCKKVTCQNENTPHVQRVEILVYTAALKMINLAQLLLQRKKKAQLKAAASSITSKTDSPPRHPRRPSASGSSSTRGQPHPPVQIPTMFVGLIKEVHSEKRRYKRKSKKGEKYEKLTSEPEEKQPEPAKEEQKPATAPAARVRRITRLYNSSKTLASDVNTDIETPAAWNRSTTSTTAPKPTRAKPRRTKSTGACSQTIQTNNPRQEARRIQKLKEQLKASKQAQKRLEGAKVEQKDAQKRAEAQERRLERLRSRTLQ